MARLVSADQLKKARQLLNLPVRQICRDLVITRTTFEAAENPKAPEGVRPALAEKLGAYYARHGVQFENGDVTLTGVGQFSPEQKLRELQIDFARKRRSPGTIARSARLSRKEVEEILSGERVLDEAAYRCLRKALDQHF